MDTLTGRWAKLEPTLVVVRPEGQGPFPTVLIFPGCGGVRSHLDRYAKAAMEAGWMVVRVESFKARGWSEAFTRTFVCTGLLFRGGERAGDVMATITGVRNLPDVDPDRLALAGWSHGAWAIMDMMTLPLEKHGEAGISDPEGVDLTGVVGAFLPYPYVGFPAATRSHDWKRPLRSFFILPTRDHLATLRQYEKALDHVRASGSPVETWVVKGTHAFDEPGLTDKHILNDPKLTEEAISKFGSFLGALSFDATPGPISDRPEDKPRLTT
jgi:dienelactone hydrolase